MNRVQQLLGVEIPIVQAPMTFIARARLAAAVSEAGGMGIIETLTAEGREDLVKVRELTDKPVGANLLVAGWKHDPSIVDTLVEAGVSYVATSAGDPALFTDRLKDAGITVFHVVGSLRAAQKAEAAGVDGLVVEGVEGGGFKGASGASTMVLLPLVASHTSLPLIAAGGICDATSMAAAFVLGAEGVQMGTRVLATHESGVHSAFTDAIVAAPETGTMLVSVPGNPTMRVIATDRAHAWAAEPPTEKLMDRVQQLYFDGDLDASLANTGQVAGRIDSVRPVAEVIDEMWSGCRDALDAGRTRLG
ncbi:nitronate monooxygenase [Nocardioides marinus]|uniref:Enoyl-[acyl-carrier protein] reductase II n=1 Tax=Nocardioides marinus TaxID=374514 RepID=A0A7Z0C2B9_9ACTN|nr:enoyl-[acyl-carrier protein] reductase II [Nocardioides marinus]